MKQKLIEFLNFLYKDNLSDLCNNFDLKYSGTKEELISRIINHIQGNTNLLFNNLMNLHIDILRYISEKLGMDSRKSKEDNIRNFQIYLLGDAINNKQEKTTKEKPIQNQITPILETATKKGNEAKEQNKNNNKQIEAITKPNSNINYQEKIEKWIKKLDIPSTFIQLNAKEIYIQDHIAKKLNLQEFHAQVNFPIGGYFNLSIDIDLDKGEFGIEIKIWSHIKGNTKEISRAIGQAYIYSNEKYKNGNYMFLVFCKEEEKNDQKLRDFRDIIKKLKGSFLLRVVE